MARPKKKPGYNRENAIAELIAKAAALYDIPYDDREERPADAATIADVAEEMETTPLRVRKLLITANMYSTAASRLVQDLAGRGMSVEEIMEKTKLRKASVYAYLPFKRGAYNLPDPTLYSEQGLRYRSRKRAVEDLQKHISHPDVSIYLWKTIIAFEDYWFTTHGRGKNHTGVARFKYSVSRAGGDSGCHYKGTSIPEYGNEIWLKTDKGDRDKSISRSTVDLALNNAIREQRENGFVSGPRKLVVPGARSYLYSIFLRFGVISDSST